MSVEFFSQNSTSYTPMWKWGYGTDLATTISFWTPASGKSIVITDLHLYATATGTIRFYVTPSSQDLTVAPTLIFQDLLIGSGRIEKEFGTPLLTVIPDGILRVVTGANGVVTIGLGGFEI